MYLYKQPNNKPKNGPSFTTWNWIGSWVENEIFLYAQN